MARLFHLYVRVNDFISLAAISVGGAIMGFAVFALLLSAFERYFIGMGYSWINDLPPLLMPWAIFPVLGVIIRDELHIRVEIAHSMLTDKPRIILQIFVHTVCFVSALTFCIGSSDAVAFFRMLGEVTELEFEFPKWWIYLAFPVGFGILANFSFEGIIRESLKLTDGTYETEVES